MLDALLREPGVEEVLDLRSPAIGFLALHGGSLDRLTDVIAGEAAARSGASLYAIVQPPTLRWHIPSEQHDPSLAPRLGGMRGHTGVPGRTIARGELSPPLDAVCNAVARAQRIIGAAGYVRAWRHLAA